MLIPRDQLSEHELKEALDECASEPIHIPGSIQPHGLLVVLSKNGIIEQISANSERYFATPAEACIGKPLADFISPHDIIALQKIRAVDRLQPIQSIVVQIGKAKFDAVAHQSGKSLVIEFEPTSQTIQPSNYYDQLRNFAIGIHKSKTLEEIFEHVTASIRQLTGFDRVKLYRFDSDWNGEVVAESRADYMPSYKGLHFPASDIPEQARRLYKQSYLRLIADTNYKPVPIIPTLNPAANAPLDLSLSTLRSVSPIHIQYLENINVHASMSVSIIQNGELWGLIACHHNKPHQIPYQMRNVCEIMGHIFSAQLSTLEDFAKREAQDMRDRLVKQLSVALEHNTRIEQLMENSHALAMNALEADGLVVKAYVHILQYGAVPEPEIVSKLIEWLKGRSQDGIFHTEDASSCFKGIASLEKLEGGILAVPISVKTHDYIIWFRNSIAQEVSWAGDPEKPVELTKAGYRLTPRSSFALWLEHVKNRSKKWSQEDINTARSVINILLESEKISAQQANLAKTEFLANMSHEIRTPMNAVIGLSRILANSEPLTEKQRQFIKTLQISADGLLALINDLLDISKIESRNLELEEIPLDLNKLLQEVISVMSVKAAEKGIAFHLEAECVEGQQFLGDPSRIRQIILNLCSNALKFTQEGRIDLKVSCSQTADPDIQKICIIVADTGIGIPSNKIETIFHKFIQGDNTISRKYGGTGLGLAITKMLTEAMGGEIHVKSELGKGSEFIVCFYLRHTESDQAKHLVKQEEKTKSMSRPLLLVEDYEANIIVATAYLDDAGYAYDIAKSGVEAVERARSKDYFAIIMDVQMPGMNGFEATQMIRQFEGANRHVPIIGMTAHALAGDRERCIAAGMDDYIPKPVDSDELIGKLKKYYSAAKSQ